MSGLLVRPVGKRKRGVEGGHPIHVEKWSGCVCVLYLLCHMVTQVCFNESYWRNPRVNKRWNMRSVFWVLEAWILTPALALVLGAWVGWWTFLQPTTLKRATRSVWTYTHTTFAVESHGSWAVVSRNRAVLDPHAVTSSWPGQPCPACKTLRSCRSLRSNLWSEVLIWIIWSPSKGPDWPWFISILLSWTAVPSGRPSEHLLHPIYSQPAESETRSHWGDSIGEEPLWLV